MLRKAQRAAKEGNFNNMCFLVKKKTNQLRTSILRWVQNCSGWFTSPVLANPSKNAKYGKLKSMYGDGSWSSITAFVSLPTLSLLHGVKGNIKIHPQCIESSYCFLWVRPPFLPLMFTNNFFIFSLSSLSWSITIDFQNKKLQYLKQHFWHITSLQLLFSHN